MSEKRPDTVSRRDFLKNGAAAGVGAPAVTGLGAQNAAAAAPAAVPEWVRSPLPNIW